MPEQKRYTAKEKLLLFVLFLASIISLVLFLTFKSAAFPEYNVHFVLSREEAAKKAEQFAETLHLQPQGYKHETIFDVDDAAKTYLEREVGVAESAQLASNKVDMWHFSTRFFKPLQKEEFTLTFLPSGRLSGFEKEVEETKEGARLSQNEARVIAEKFITQYTHIRLGDWNLVSEDSIERPNRRDHEFTWENKNFKAKDATYRVDVRVIGSEVGGYGDYLKVPESWARQYEKERSRNTLAQVVAEFISFLLFGISLIITFVLNFRKNNLRFRIARFAGWLTVVITLLTYLNDLPLTLYSYPTTQSWNIFLGQILFGSIIGSLTQGLLVFFIVISAEALYREVFPKKVALEVLVMKGFLTKNGNKSIFVGTFAGIIMFTYVVVYYILGKQIGYWSPAEINYSDVYSTIIPWIYPLFIGVTAAVTEEGVFRLFGIPFFIKIFKKPWIAVLITSVAWAFLHSNYPQSPWFARGVEISFVGIIFGVLFLRFGILASLVAHFTFNAFQTAISFYSSNNTYIGISSTVVSFIPLIIALFGLFYAYAKKGFFTKMKDNAEVSHELEQTVEKPGEKESALVPVAYLPLTKMRKLLLVVLIIISAALLWSLGSKITLQNVVNTLTRQDAAMLAAEQLPKEKQKEQYKAVAQYTSSDPSSTVDYILEKANFRTLQEIVPQKIPTTFWNIRFFKPLQKEEYNVSLLSDGTVYQVRHIVSEDAAGTNLSEEQAKKVAEEYLEKKKNYIMSNYALVDSQSEKRQKRTDYAFTFEEKNKKIADATFRTDLDVLGNEPSGFIHYLKLPEDWIREKSKTTTLDFIAGILLILVGVGIASIGFITFLQMVRRKLFQFRLAFIYAFITFVSMAGGTINSIPTFYANYNTSIPLSSYTVQAILGTVVSHLVVSILAGMTIAMFIGMWKAHMGPLYPKNKSMFWQSYKDGMIAGYTLPFIIVGLGSLVTYIFTVQNWLRSYPVGALRDGFDTLLPFFTILGQLPLYLSLLAFGGVVFLLLFKYLKRWRLVILFFVGIAILSSVSGSKELSDFTLALVQQLLLLTGCLLAVVLFMRNNLFTYFFAFYSSVVAGGGWLLLNQQNTFYRVNGVVLLFFAASPIIFYLWKGRSVKYSEKERVK